MRSQGDPGWIKVAGILRRLEEMQGRQDAPGASSAIDQASSPAISAESTPRESASRALRQRDCDGAPRTATRESRTTAPFHGQGRLRDQPLLPLPGACATTDPGSLSIGIQTALPAPRSERDSPERRYVRAVLGRYLWLPDTPAQSSRYDRHLACRLFERGVPLLVVEAALLLGATRRALREPSLAALPRVRSLSYFVPVLAEVLENPRPPDLDYLTCLLRRLRPLAELKAAQLAHQRLYGDR